MGILDNNNFKILILNRHYKLNNRTVQIRRKVIKNILSLIDDKKKNAINFEILITLDSLQKQIKKTYSKELEVTYYEGTNKKTRKRKRKRHLGNNKDTK